MFQYSLSTSELPNTLSLTLLLYLVNWLSKQSQTTICTVTIMRELLRCRNTGWAVALPDSFRSLKTWLLTRQVYGPEFLQCLRCYLFPPRHGSIGMWRWFCLHPRLWVRGSWGQETRAEYITAPVQLGEEKAGEELCLTAWLLVPRTVPRTLVYVESMDHCWSWSFCPGRAPWMWGAGRSFETRAARPLRPFLSQCN